MYKQEITHELLSELYTKRCDLFKERYPTSDKPKMLFDTSYDYSEFLSDNWNSGQDLLRNAYLTNILDLFGYDSFRITDIIKTDADIYEIEISFTFVSDQQTFVLIEHNQKEDSVFEHIYHVGWYKIRGCTQRIDKDTDPIDLSDYIKLLNILRFSKYFSSELPD